MAQQHHTRVFGQEATHKTKPAYAHVYTFLFCKNLWARCHNLVGSLQHNLGPNCTPQFRERWCTYVRTRCTSHPQVCRYWHTCCELLLHFFCSVLGNAFFDGGWQAVHLQAQQGVTDSMTVEVGFGARPYSSRKAINLYDTLNGCWRLKKKDISTEQPALQDIPHTVRARHCCQLCRAATDWRQSNNAF